MSASNPVGIAGTTLVLGASVVKGLAKTGSAVARAVWTTVAGAVSIVAGAVLVGRGRRVRAGEPLDSPGACP